jgi:hypothetical protein
VQHAHAYLTRGDHYALLPGAIGLSRHRLKTVQHAHAYLIRGDYYALLTKAIGLSQQRLKTVPHACNYSYKGRHLCPMKKSRNHHTASLSAFRTWGVPGPTSKLSPRAPAQMGRRETEREGGKKPEGDRRKRGNPRPSCLSRS